MFRPGEAETGYRSDAEAELVNARYHKAMAGKDQPNDLAESINDTPASLNYLSLLANTNNSVQFHAQLTWVDSTQLLTIGNAGGLGWFNPEDELIAPLDCASDAAGTAPCEFKKIIDERLMASLIGSIRHKDNFYFFWPGFDCDDCSEACGAWLKHPYPAGFPYKSYDWMPVLDPVPNTDDDETLPQYTPDKIIEHHPTDQPWNDPKPWHKSPKIIDEVEEDTGNDSEDYIYHE